MTRQKNNNQSDYALVYSTDARESEKKAVSRDTGFSGTLDPRARIEKKGRGGKSVTVLFRLPAHKTLLDDLCSFLKRSLGTGGTSYIKNSEGFIEVQGERLDEAISLARKYAERKKAGS